MDTRDIKGHLTQLKQYAISVLGYDKVSVSCKIEMGEYEIVVDCDDTFQSKGDYSSRVEQALISEEFDWEVELNEAVGQIYERLARVMKREERELRYGLNLIGKTIEAGADYRTHVGLEFVSSMKREQEKTMLMLPNRNNITPEPEFQPEPEFMPERPCPESQEPVEASGPVQEPPNVIQF